MRISINNFKSIGSLAKYEMRPLTILSGTNSSGKSSFIQLLLLLKQTLEIDSAQRPLDLVGELFSVRDYLDILKEKNEDNRLRVGFLFNKSELIGCKNYGELTIYNSFENYNLSIDVEFDIRDRQVVVSLFVVQIENDLKTDFIKFVHERSSYSVDTNVAVFSEKLYREEYSIKRINYSAFVPASYEIVFNDGRTDAEVPKFEGIKNILKDFFAKLYYIGPLRDAPKEEYVSNAGVYSVGTDGANVAEIFCELSEKPIIFYKIEETDGNVSFVKSEDKFINAVKYWLCERFRMCADIYSQKQGDLYVIYVKSFSGIISTIKQVGFGISQVLPIIVEGLRIEDNETLVLEQPEIHLHPKVQSSLTDFLVSLVEQGKKVIVETHSDHLITRLRRRIAEDPNNQLDNKTLLTFVEVGQNDVLFKNIDIDDFGVVELPYPVDFIESSDNELKAILKAQMNKRLNQ